MGIPTVPMGVWEDGKKIQVLVGTSFFMSSEEADQAAVEAMFEVAKCLPSELRGPFK